MSEHTCEYSGITFPTKDGWNKCSDRLPEKNGYYLIAYLFDKHYFYKDCWFNVTAIKSNFSGFQTTNNVTHWMPLPSVPEDLK